MGGGQSNYDWRGSNEEMAELMMPLYYIKDCEVVDDEIQSASFCWEKVRDGTAMGFMEYKSAAGDESDSPILFFTKIFYGRLFDVNPSSEELFKGGMDSQMRVLTSIITTALSPLHDPSSFRKSLEALAHVHSKRGVKGVQFAVAGDVLLWSFTQALRDDFTEERRIIWMKLYSGMLKVIVPVAIGDEREIYRAMKQKEKKEMKKVEGYKSTNP